MNILLDYVMPVTSITPTAAASTAFLKQVCVVVSPLTPGVGTGVITLCTSNSAVAALTANTDVAQLFAAGMSRVYILPMDDLDLADALEGHESDFFTVLISSDFAAAAVIPTQATGNFTITSYANLVSGTDDTVTIDGVVFTAQATAVTLGEATFQAATSNDDTAASLRAQINAHAATALKVTASGATNVVTLTAVSAGSSGNYALAYTDNDTNVGATKSGTAMTGGDGLYLGEYTGVVGVSSTDDSFLEDQAVISNRVAFHTTSGNKAKNMFYAFGSLLSNASNWKNQQFIEVPVADDVDTLGEALNLFDLKISFVIEDDEYSNRLGLFAAGGKAIVAPYIKRNLELDLQSASLSYISGNQPAYTKTQAALLEDELQKVIDLYIDTKKWIEDGTASVELINDNFVATASFDIAEPKAMWRIEAEISQTL